jgi:hypothetical protein
MVDLYKRLLMNQFTILIYINLSISYFIYILQSISNHFQIFGLNHHKNIGCLKYVVIRKE